MVKSLTLIDLEDFLPVLQLDQTKNGIGEDEFIERQYKRFMELTSENILTDYEEHRKLDQFKHLVLSETEHKKNKNNKIRRNYLYNLVYNKYMYDIGDIKSQNIYNNFYFTNQENGIIKQFFVASVQVLFTILLLIQIISTFDEIDWENNLNIALGVIIMYLSVTLINPQVSSIVHDLKILRKYFHLHPINSMLNIMTNVLLALVLPFVTFFVILSSESMTDVVLNATAIAFIIELDDDAADEVDLENWFVTASTSVERIFKRIVPFDDDIITNDTCIESKINSTIRKIRNELKDLNTKVEYDGVNIGTKLLYILKNIGGFILSPILMFLHPVHIIKDVCKRMHDTDDNEAQHNQVTVDYAIDAKEFDEEANGVQSEEKEHLDASSDGIKLLNDKGNDAVIKYRFNEAHDKYNDAISLLSEDIAKHHNQKTLNALIVLHYNNGCALYKRAKRSWIDEIFTDESGRPYKNYKAAITSFDSCKSYSNAVRQFGGDVEHVAIQSAETGLSKSGYAGIKTKDEEEISGGRTAAKGALTDKSNTISLDKYNALCDKFMSDIYYELFEYDHAYKCYEEYKTKCSVDVLNMKRYKEIKQRKNEFHDMQYLKILDDFKDHALDNNASECDHEQKECPITKLNDILDDTEKPELYTNDEWNDIIARCYYFRSLFYSLTFRSLLQKRKGLEERKTQKEIEKGKLPHEHWLYSETVEALADIQTAIDHLDDEIKDKSDYHDKAEDDATQAKQRSSLYAWTLFNAIQTQNNKAPSNALCNELIVAFTKSIEFDPQQRYYYFIRGSAYYELSKQKNRHYLDKALHDFNKALELDKTNTIFRINLGCCQLCLEQDDAYDSFEKVFGEVCSVKAKLYLMFTYFDDGLKEDVHKMTSKEYRRFLDRLDEIKRKTFAELQPVPSDDVVFDIEEFDGLVERYVSKEKKQLLFDDVRRFVTRPPADIEHLNNVATEAWQYLRDIVFRVLEFAEINDEMKHHGLNKETWNTLHTIFKSVKCLADLSSQLMQFGTFSQFAGMDQIIDYDEFFQVIDRVLQKSHDVLLSHIDD